MLRVISSLAKSPVTTFPALAAAIGCLVSGYSTFNGISEIFPDFRYSVLAALGLAAIIQLGMLTSALAIREPNRYQPMLIAVIAFTVLMSSFTSYVFYFRGFSEETIAKDRQIERYESLRAYVVGVRGETAGTLGILREAGAELRRRIEIEQASGGGLRNISNPYLQRLVAESDLNVDLRTVQSGSGERYRFLSTVLPRVEQMESEVAGALQALDGELGLLTGDDAIDHDGLRALYARTAAVVPAGRIEEVRGNFSPPHVDATILDTSPLEEEEYWQRAVADLTGGSASAVVFAFIALFIDTMIVFFAFIAGEDGSQATTPRVPLAHWLRMAYERRYDEGLRRWMAALDGVRLQRGSAMLHRLDVRQLEDPRDTQCARYLRQDGYLQQVVLEDGQTHWCMTDEAYGGLVELTRRAFAESLPVAVEVMPT